MIWALLFASTVRSALHDDFGIAASSIAFAAFLALIPLVGLIAGAYGVFVSPAVVADNLGKLVAILPVDAQRLLAGNLNPDRLIGQGGVTTLIVSVGITLFSARWAGRSLLHGINLAYRIERGAAWSAAATRINVAGAGLHGAGAEGADLAVDPRFPAKLRAGRAAGRRFDDTYGSLAAMVVLMRWLMVSAWVLLLGARLNAEAMDATGIPIRERQD